MRRLRFAACLFLALSSAAGADAPAVTKKPIPRDVAEAQAAAEHVYALWKKGDYAAIYRDSAPGFKAIGSEANFLALMDKIRGENGDLKDASPILCMKGSDKSVGTTYAIPADLSFDKGHAQNQMTFVRSSRGIMQLYMFNESPMQSPDEKPLEGPMAMPGK